MEQNVPNDQGASKPADQSRRASDRKEETTNFELSSKTTTVVSDGYRIENIAVAVVVNRKPLLAAAGDSKPGAVDEQIKSIEQLVSSAAGLQPSRGDKATVVAVDFANGSDLEPVSAPVTIWEQILGQTGNYLIAAAIVLSTIIFISVGLRPSLRLILESKKAPALEAAQVTGEAKLVGVSAEGALAQGGPPPIAGPASARPPSPLRQAEKAIQLNDEQAAEILKQWLKEG